MKKSLLLFAVLSLFSFTCCDRQQTGDAENIKATLNSYFRSVENKDFQKMKELTTSDYVSFEDGKIYTHDQLIEIIKLYPNLKATYTADSLVVSAGNTVGAVRYIVHAEFILNDTTVVRPVYLQSATFQKIDGEWKLSFIHASTRK